MNELMFFLLLLSICFLTLGDVGLCAESKESSDVGPVISPVSISLGFNTPKIPGQSLDTSCTTMVLEAIDNIRIIQTEANGMDGTKQCYIKAMFYDFNDNNIIDALNAARAAGVYI